MLEHGLLLIQVLVAEICNSDTLVLLRAHPSKSTILIPQNFFSPLRSLKDCIVRSSGFFSLSVTRQYPSLSDTARNPFFVTAFLLFSQFLKSCILLFQPVHQPQPYHLSSCQARLSQEEKHEKFS